MSFCFSKSLESTSQLWLINSNNSNIKWQIIQIFQQRLCHISCRSTGQRHLLIVHNLKAPPQLLSLLCAPQTPYLYFHIVAHLALCTMLLSLSAVPIYILVSQARSLFHVFRVLHKWLHEWKANSQSFIDFNTNQGSSFPWELLLFQYVSTAHLPAFCSHNKKAPFYNYLYVLSGSSLKRRKKNLEASNSPSVEEQCFSF